MSKETLTETQQRQVQYLIKCLDAMSAIFDEESENYIGLEELEKDNNMTEFMHVVANSLPAQIYQKLTSQEINNLDFNHIANKLCFQYSTEK